MSYATRQSLIDRFGEQKLIDLTDRADPATGAIDDDVLGQALADADNEINAYIGARYELPLASVPEVVKRVAADITLYYLFADQVTELVRQRYEDARKFLQSVADGKVTLGLDQANTPAKVADTVQFNTSGKVFGRDAE